MTPISSVSVRFSGIDIHYLASDKGNPSTLTCDANLVNDERGNHLDEFGRAANNTGKVTLAAYPFGIKELFNQLGGMTPENIAFAERLVNALPIGEHNRSTFRNAFKDAWERQERGRKYDAIEAAKNLPLAPYPGEQ